MTEEAKSYSKHLRVFESLPEALCHMLVSNKCLITLGTIAQRHDLGLLKSLWLLFLVSTPFKTGSLKGFQKMVEDTSPHVFEKPPKSTDTYRMLCILLCSGPCKGQKVISHFRREIQKYTRLLETSLCDRPLTPNWLIL